MKEIRWNRVKSDRLKLVRGVSFEELLTAEVIAIWKHPKNELLYFKKIDLFEFGRMNDCIFVSVFFFLN